MVLRVDKVSKEELTEFSLQTNRFTKDTTDVAVSKSDI